MKTGELLNHLASTMKIDLVKFVDCVNNLNTDGDVTQEIIDYIFKYEKIRD